MVRIATVGIGFMGMIHYTACKQLKGGKVAAICTRDERKLAGDWTMIQGNFGPRGGHEDLSKVKKYRGIDDLLADPGIDLVDLCLPTQLHKETTIKALRAGKHVLLEKPIAVSLGDAREMMAVARKSGRLFMVAHVLPFFPEFAYAYKAVNSGKYGKLLGAHLERIISKPEWSADLMDMSKSGGPGIDLHIHDNHFIQLLCGVPDGVYSQGILAGDYLQYVTTQYVYEKSQAAVSCASGAICQRGRPFAHGYAIYMEKASLIYDMNTPLTLLDNKGNAERPMAKPTGPVDAFVAEIQYAVDAIRKGTDPVALSGEGAFAALELCWQEAKSVKTGKIVKPRR
jgi:predicted dehydrogenase